MNLSLGDLVQLRTHQSDPGGANLYVNMYEDDRLESIEKGDSFHPHDIGIVLESVGSGDYAFYKILTPRSTVGWIHGFHLRPAG